MRRWPYILNGTRNSGLDIQTSAMHAVVACATAQRWLALRMHSGVHNAPCTPWHGVLRRMLLLLARRIS